MNLWNPSGHMSLWMIFATALVLGMVHGITPDEHTWPITFSYSIGSYSTRGGMKAGFLFSLAFMLQRAIASEIAYVALSSIMAFSHMESTIYMVVGVVMAISGAYILRVGKHIHFLGFIEQILDRLVGEADRKDGAQISDESIPRRSPLKLALLHGFIAGWGTGAFALIIYTVLSPQMPSVYLGFAPGLMFGLGTMIMQILLGAVVGFLFSKIRVDQSLLPYVARRVSGMVLLYGGLVFVVVGLAGLLLPINEWQVNTGLHIHNLDSLGVGFFLSVIMLFFVAGISMISTMRHVRTKKP